ncbi:energy transducer TonB [Roseisolibacter agri]|uniref:energy transducer TonB n=1 Tax=Roseisolibacter agri TaxID=2014610 RepID=UPI0024E11725|nr:energy transducer TonB [Roseisolibacter agri]
MLAATACQGRAAGADERPGADSLAGAAAADSGATSAATAAASVAAPAAPPADGPPRMTNTDPPFRYPAALYARKVQGNITLRLWVDSTGAVVPDSTRVAEPSGYPALDSSAVAGSEKLRFTPGMKDGRPTGAAILFPVFFRHPEAAPLPGDTVLRARP